VAFYQNRGNKSMQSDREQQSRLWPFRIASRPHLIVQLNAPPGAFHCDCSQRRSSSTSFSVLGRSKEKSSLPRAKLKR
jgi:hypothetical protein